MPTEYLLPVYLTSGLFVYTAVVSSDFRSMWKKESYIKESDHGLYSVYGILISIHILSSLSNVAISITLMEELLPVYLILHSSSILQPSGASASFPVF